MSARPSRAGEKHEPTSGCLGTPGASEGCCEDAAPEVWGQACAADESGLSASGALVAEEVLLASEPLGARRPHKPHDAAATPKPVTPSPYARAACEDDDGYDPWSDRPAEPEPLFEEDPWA